MLSQHSIFQRNFLLELVSSRHMRWRDFCPKSCDRSDRNRKIKSAHTWMCIVKRERYNRFNYLPKNLRHVIFILIICTRHFANFFCYLTCDSSGDVIWWPQKCRWSRATILSCLSYHRIVIAWMSSPLNRISLTFPHSHTHTLFRFIFTKFYVNFSRIALIGLSGL